AAPQPRHHFHLVRGTFLDPGPTLTNIQPIGANYTFDMSGGTKLFGDLSGDTTYTGTGVYDPAADKVTIEEDEAFTGTVAGVGTGTLVLRDHVVTNGASSSGYVLTVVTGTGDLANVRGYLAWSWNTINADGSIPGSYAGFVVG